MDGTSIRIYKQCFKSLLILPLLTTTLNNYKLILDIIFKWKAFLADIKKLSH